MKNRDTIGAVRPQEKRQAAIIADSGSTRTEWGLAQGDGYVRRILTGGMNPYFQSAAEMDAIIREKVAPEIGDCGVGAVYFYGAGCGSEEKKRFTAERIEAGLNVPAYVESDMLGAARALLGRARGVACIMGTGSNSCLYDGDGIVDQVPALGFILGDEGSGATLGKLLLGELFKRKLSPDLSRKLYELGVNQADVLEHTYKRAFPNRYLASFAPFIHAHIHEEEIRDIVYSSFRSFFERNVMQYQGYQELPISFTGSIAFHFEEVLRAAAQSVSVRINSVEQNPMDGLARFHLASV